MTRHLRSGVRIADLVLQRLARLSGSLPELPVIPLQKDEEGLAPFELRRPLFIAIGQGLPDLGV
jgi:hypothetical protein